MNAKEIGTIVINAAVVLGLFGLVAARVIKLGDAVFYISALLVPSVAPTLLASIKNALTQDPQQPPRGPSVVEKDEGQS